MKYLDKQESATLINLGKTIEQWLKPKYDSETKLYIIRWIEVDKDKRDTCVLRLYEVYDEPNTNTLDFGYFSLAIFNTRWAEAPNPVSPKFCPSFMPVNLRDR